MLTVDGAVQVAQLVASATKKPLPQLADAGVLMTVLFAASCTETFRDVLPDVAFA